MRFILVYCVQKVKRRASKTKGVKFMDNINILLAANIQTFRKKGGLTQTELAEKVECDHIDGNVTVNGQS